MSFVTLPNVNKSSVKVQASAIVSVQHVANVLPSYTAVTLVDGRVLETCFTPLQIEREIEKAMSVQKEYIPLNPERDAAIRKLAGEFSQTAAGTDVSVAISAAALFIVAQSEVSPKLAAYAAAKLAQVVSILTDCEPKEGALLDSQQVLSYKSSVAASAVVYGKDAIPVRPPLPNPVSAAGLFTREQVQQHGDLLIHAFLSLRSSPNDPQP